MRQEKNPEKEMLWEIDKNNIKLGSIERTIAHTKGIYHRSAHVIIFKEPKYKNIILQLRGHGTYNFCRYGQSASGHVRHSETYREAALSEISEELFNNARVPKEIKNSLELRCNFRYEKNHKNVNNKEWVALYTAIFSGEFNPDPDEVKGIKEVSTEKIIFDLKIGTCHYTTSFERDIRFLLSDEMIRGYSG